MEEEGALAIVIGKLGNAPPYVAYNLESSAVHWAHGFYGDWNERVGLRELNVLSVFLSAAASAAPPDVPAVTGR